MPDEQPLDMKADGESPTQSSCFDYVFSMICFACIIVPLALGIAADKSLALGYLYAWLFLIVRVHLHIWWLGGLTAFSHLAWRFPATWLNTVTFYPIFVGCKFIQWIFCEILYFDPVGQLYKCKGTGLTLERYARMTRDLDKPLLFRKGDTYMNFTIYPFMLSTQLACNIYSMGPYTGFGILTIMFDEHHCTFRNGMLGTHPAYNYHVSVVFDNSKGEAHWHTAHALVPGMLLAYRYLWEYYAANMIHVIEESESRAGEGVTAPSADLDATWPATDGTCLRPRPWRANTERTHTVISTPVKPLMSAT